MAMSARLVGIIVLVSALFYGFIGWALVRWSGMWDGLIALFGGG